MITPKEIKDKTERKYISFLQSLVEQRPFEKLVIRGDKSYTKSSLSEFEREIQQIHSHSKGKKGFGYTLDFQKVKTKFLGVQDLPISIYFDNEKDFLKFLGKEYEVDSFKSNIEIILREFPELKDWIIKNPKKVIDNANEWINILQVCQYFKQNPKPNFYIRELPVKVHTKFVERNKSIIRELLDVLISEHVKSEEKEFENRFNLKYAEPQIRFKVLDKTISDRFFSGIDDIAIPVSQFEKLDLPIFKVLVVENKTTLYTTLTLPKMNDTIAIFGSGFSVFNLKNVRWFDNLKLLYWGDIDVQGFEILSQFRTYFPQTRSVLMDKQTFDNFFEDDNGTPTNISTKLTLTDEEQLLYDILKTNNWRLEQEKIPLEYVNKYFDNE
ncbi:Wadjet anti-phage system protein JetD domain-containing protein [Algoriphagus algorifonticola]|uniref:Wadjet anti-phage system protein JetD domain-containing protein n=1 Tax=Algoriphagus algorifonticola TaxID=2593007 RepID=UPI0011A45E16|nr:Wadjet anti-phage system protein JetD domain-containing protein [Algoriphagus algorifonticola]